MTTLDGENLRSFRIGTRSQILDVNGYLITGECFRLDGLPGTETQGIIEAAPVGINGRWSKLQSSLPLEKLLGQFILCNQRILFPADSVMEHLDANRRRTLYSVLRNGLRLR